ncbi:hypothetical protein QJS04_geneDACA012973 [Acorus gramineus]|uniref:proline--tRNA ligase n=1 Tax=Acorus gramineus TaxID=55184 RepID=A0AAV9B859_ACOGR|nr:hypothetical protein QJS04_geneDACA012973 [Acorus gramineus]
MVSLRLTSLAIFTTHPYRPSLILRSSPRLVRFHRNPFTLSSSKGFSTQTLQKDERPIEGDDAKGSQQPKKGMITPRSADFSAWYLDVIREAELADYGPVRGTMVIRPYGYAIWEAIQDYLNVKFKETGHSNMYFPQFIPYSFIKKEASHVEGFSPELALVTIGGGKELEEELVWANVTRWEMRTKPFVRTLEFLWQEGHTAHATAEEAEKEALQMIDLYKKFAYEQAAIPVIAGRKSRVETFAGASRTYTIEAMMGDKKALQAGTSHNLGQNFSKAFETQFQDESGQRRHVWQTSWAISTRFIGAIIMNQGDDIGLMLPPRVAPIQVIIVPIWKKEEEKTTVSNAAASLEEILKSAGIRVKLDDSEQNTPGWKFNFWEMKGVPIRIEIGPRDVSSGTVVVCRRDIPGKQGKDFGVSMERSKVEAHVRAKLDEIQASLLEKATSFRDSNIVDVSSYDELKAVISQGKWARGPWSASDEEELRVKEETGATIRCYPFEQPMGRKTCFMTEEEIQTAPMASKQLVAIFTVVVVTVLPSITLATEYTVGDDQGWMINYNYSEWTAGKMFQVGDSLVFNYNKDSHNVFKVNGSQFQACDVSSLNATNSFTTGHDVIPLKTTGNKWYICGKVGHCELGQKLVITVMDMTSASTRTSASGLASFIAATSIIAVMLASMF